MNPTPETKQEHFEIEISKIKLDTKNIPNYKNSLDKLVSLEKNQRVFDFVLSDIKNNISGLSQILKDQPNERKNLADFVLGLWKIDKENYQIHRDESVYKDLIYQLFGGVIPENTQLETSKKSYEDISSFAEELGILYKGFLNQSES
jgi:hypothetical protein